RGGIVSFRKRRTLLTGEVVADAGREEVEVTVVVQVTEGQAHPRGRLVGQAGCAGNVRELARAVVVEDLDDTAINAREPGGREGRLIVGVDDVQIAILVVVHEGHTPGDRRIAGRHVLKHQDARAFTHVLEDVVALVEIQLVRVV